MLRTVVFALLAVLTPLASAHQDRVEPGGYCDRVGLSAAEASRLRLTGMSREAVANELQKSFSEREIGMGVTAAFTYTDLRDFAMSDFMSDYCGIVTATGGNLSDSVKLLIRTHYDRAVECSKNGHTEKRQFIECRNEQLRRAKDAASKK
jgi:hypothetical protein